MKVLDLLLEETQLEPQQIEPLLIESLQELHGDLFESNNQKFLTRLSSGGIELTNLSNTESRYEKIFLAKRPMKELYFHLLKKNNINSSDENKKILELRLTSLTTTFRVYGIKNQLLSASIINPNKEQYFFADKSDDNDKLIFKLLSIDLPKSPNERSKTKYYEAVISINDLTQPSIIIVFEKISNRGGKRPNAGMKKKWFN